MRCIIDENDVYMYGNYDTVAARNIMVVFEKCDPEKSKVPCKNET